MAIFNDQRAVTDTAVQVIDDTVAPNQARTITMVNQGSSTIYLGASDVDSDHGFRLLAGAGCSQEFENPNDLHAVCASGESSTLDYITESN